MTDAPAAVEVGAVGVEVDALEPPPPAAAAAADGRAEVVAMLATADSKPKGKGIMTTSAGTNQGSFGAAEWALFWSIGLSGSRRSTR